VAGVIALVGVTWPAFAVLAVPGAVCLLLLFTLKRHSTVAEPETVAASHPVEAPVSTIVEPRALSMQFYAFATSCGLGTLGLMTFGVISFHLVDAGLVTTAVVPLVYAAAMATEAVAALVTGFAYDRWGAAVLYTLPVTVIAVPALTLASTLTVVLAGVLLWGAVTGVQDSTVKALVADLVPPRRLATAYGVFAAFQGVAALAGGVLAGGLYTEHRTLLIALVAVMQLGSAVLLAIALRRRPDQPRRAEA
jgi:MFS family permease